MREPEKVTNTGSLLSLSDWFPWQNRLQETHVVDHSLETHHLVELLEFTDLQGDIPLFTQSICVHDFLLSDKLKATSRYDTVWSFSNIQACLDVGWCSGGCRCLRCGRSLVRLDL